MSKKSHHCLACPRSCNIRPQIDGFPGQKLCPKGNEFLLQEKKDPKRHYFSTVREENGQIYAYRTVYAISQKSIEEMHNRLSAADSSETRNKIHQEFCKNNLTKKTCIDLKA